MGVEVLARDLRLFLASSPDAAVLEDGTPLFDLRHAKYSVSEEHGRCLLHIWSAERNTVRRVVESEVRGNILRLAVMKMGQSRPSRLEICSRNDRRPPQARQTERRIYRERLRRVLGREFPDYTVADLRIAADLEKSFGPVHARGLLKRGASAWAVLGVNALESQGAVDAALTFGILWLDLCRNMHAGRAVVEGLKLILPRGTTDRTRERMVHLHHAAAKFQLFDLGERDDALRELDWHDCGNLQTRLLACISADALAERLADAITVVRGILHEAEVIPLSAIEAAFRWHGLTFARARWSADAASDFRGAAEVVFGMGAEETVLGEHNRSEFVTLLHSIAEVRHSEGPRTHPYFRAASERWLESLIARDVSLVDERLDPRYVYSQVPAFAAADRAMLDVLTMTRESRLAVVELKADDDIHLPLQGLDYWARVAWHNQRGEFTRLGYFAGRELSPLPPLLLMAAPALHVHPATDTILRYFSRRLSGRCWGWTSAGATGCGWCSASGRGRRPRDERCAQQAGNLNRLQRLWRGWCIRRMDRLRCFATKHATDAAYDAAHRQFPLFVGEECFANA